MSFTKYLLVLDECDYKFLTMTEKSKKHNVKMNGNSL